MSRWRRQWGRVAAGLPPPPADGARKRRTPAGRTLLPFTQFGEHAFQRLLLARGEWKELRVYASPVPKVA